MTGSPGLKERFTLKVPSFLILLSAEGYLWL